MFGAEILHKDEPDTPTNNRFRSTDFSFKYGSKMSSYNWNSAIFLHGNCLNSMIIMGTEFLTSASFKYI
jgi:hypothetical protein